MTAERHNKTLLQAQWLPLLLVMPKFLQSNKQTNLASTTEGLLGNVGHH